MSRRRSRISSANSPPDKSRDFVGEHVGLAVSVALGVAAATKVIVVAHGDPVTVSALARHLDLGGLLAIVLVSGAPALGAVLGFLGASSLMEAIREEDAIKGPLVAFGLGLALSFALAPKGVFLGLLLLAAIMLSSSMAVRTWRERRRSANGALNFLLRNHPTQVSVKWAVATTVVVAVAVVVLSDAPWLPRERLSFRGGNSQVGYVLAEGDTMTIMDGDDRTVELRPASEVSGRDFCESGVPWLGDRGHGRSMFAELLWSRRGGYVSCSEVGDA